MSKYILPMTGDEVRVLLGTLISEDEWDELLDEDKKEILYFIYEEEE